jgi:glutamate N-acetyltransferase/amino-acid N-acetyltransferase
VITEAGPAAIAATFTTNRLPAAAVRMNQQHLAVTEPGGGGRYGWSSAMMASSGCANAATGQPGLDDQRVLAKALAGAVGTDASFILAMNTGMIGTRLPVERIVTAMDTSIAAGLGSDDATYAAVAEALRTTDSRPKAAAIRLELPDANGQLRTVTIGGVAKGVGMIHPNMATMLCFVLTDAAVGPATLHRILRPIVARTWDQISVDGDQSTNDTVLLAASGAADAAPLEADPEALADFARALEAVCRSLARQQAADGEGAATLISCAVSGALDDAGARAAARAVVSSDLVKAAIHGADPNWGRIAMAVGNATVASTEVLEAAGLDGISARARANQPVEIDVDRLRIDIEGVPVFGGVPMPFDEAALRARMAGSEVQIRIDLGVADGRGEAFGCDLTEQYVIENSEYST